MTKLANDWRVVLTTQGTSTTVRVVPVPRETSREKHSQLGVRTVDMTPAVWWNELHDV